MICASLLEMDLSGKRILDCGTGTGILSICEVQGAAVFYGHPQNRFWKVVAAVFGQEVPATIPEKKELILDNGLALWDSIASCVISGSSDAAIREVVPNDLRVVLSHAPIRRIFCNGKKSYEMYEKYILPATGMPAICLPSTSPANAQWSLERLTDAWAVLREP